MGALGYKHFFTSTKGTGGNKGTVGITTAIFALNHKY
jgi:hypothetical protein